MYVKGIAMNIPMNKNTQPMMIMPMTVNKNKKRGKECPLVSFQLFCKDSIMPAFSSIMN